MGISLGILATTEGIMAAVGIAGMVGSVASSTVSGVTQTNSLQKQIQDLNKRAADWKVKYAELLGNLSNITADQEQYISEMIKDYQSTATQVKSSQDLANASYRQIQITGLIFVSVIFILLLMKKTNILRPFFNILDYPAKVAWNYIVHGESTPFVLGYSKSE